MGPKAKLFSGGFGVQGTAAHGDRADILLYHCEYHRKPIPEHGNDKVESPPLFPGAWMFVKEFLGQIHLPPFNGLPNICFMGWPKSQMKKSSVLQLLRGEIDIETKACKSWQLVYLSIHLLV